MWYNIGTMETTAKDILYGIATQKFKDELAVATIKYDIIQHGMKKQRRKDIVRVWIEWLVFMLVGAGLSVLFFIKGERIGGIVSAVLFGVLFTGAAIWNMICVCFAHSANLIDLEEVYRDAVKTIVADYTKEFLSILGTYSETECKRQQNGFDTEFE